MSGILSPPLEGAPKTRGALLKEVERALSESPKLARSGLVGAEAEQLVFAAFASQAGTPLRRIDLYSSLEQAVPPPVTDWALIMARERVFGRPLQHLTGQQVFLDHDYHVGPVALIPRPETEVLVTAAIEDLSQGEPPSQGFELGLGSGVLSIELLARFPGLRMTASELSPDAAELAGSNALRILGPVESGSGRLAIRLVSGPLEVWPVWEGRDRPDFLISNPPYLIPGSDAEVDEEVVRYEPASSLFAPEGDPLYFYRELSRPPRAFAKPGLRAFLEVPHERAVAIQAVFGENGWEASLKSDLTGRPRVLIARLAESL